MMRFPSWEEFTEGLSNFEKSIDEKILTLKEDHPLLNKAILESMKFLPSPFNQIAENFYNRFEKNPEENIHEVKEILSKIIDRGQIHYEKIAIQLDGIFFEITDLKKLISNNPAIDNISKILTSSSTKIETEIHQLSKPLDVKINIVHQDVLKNQTMLKEIFEKLKIEKTVTPLDNKIIPNDVQIQLQNLYVHQVPQHL